MRRASASGRQRGWSLVELAIALLIMAVVGLLTWALLPLGRQVYEKDLLDRDLRQVEEALVGYALAHARMPAPVVEKGMPMLPVQELGLPARLKMPYQVQPALTQPATDRFAPVLPPPLDGSAATPPAQVNGLDFCMALKEQSTASLAGMQGVPTAFAVMHGGPAGDSRGLHATFVLPGSSAQGPRAVRAIGPGELAARLGCPDRISRTLAAASGAYAAYDLARIAGQNVKVREFALRVAELNESNADTARLFAKLDLSFGILLEVLAGIDLAAGFPPEGLSLAIAIASHPVALTQIGLAAAAVADAEAEYTEAQAATQQAKERLDTARQHEQRMKDLAAAARSRALELDRRGLQP